MPVDSFKYLPKSFRPMFEGAKIEVEGSVWAPFEKDTTYFGDSGQSYMINLMVDDLPGALAQVGQGGAEVMDKTEESEFGHFGWFIDPEGNKVELWQPPA